MPHIGATVRHKSELAIQSAPALEQEKQLNDDKRTKS